jgi:hypothetical protein
VEGEVAMESSAAKGSSSTGCHDREERGREEEEDGGILVYKFLETHQRHQRGK